MSDDLVERLKENPTGWMKVCLTQSESLCREPCPWRKARADRIQKAGEDRG